MVTYLRRLIPEKVLSSGTRESDSLTAADERRLARLGEAPRSGSSEADEPVLLISFWSRRVQGCFLLECPRNELEGCGGGGVSAKLRGWPGFGGTLLVKVTWRGALGMLGPEIRV